MNINEIGERELIERIRNRVRVDLKPAPTRKEDRVLVGIGDDSTVIKASPKRLLLASTDSFVEGVHFSNSYFTYQQIGIKALAASLSDIAAMGGIPREGLLSFFLPPDMRVDYVDEIISGLLEVGNRFHVSLVGGNIVRSKTFSLSITILGEVERSKLILRSSAKKGDLICVTGDLGKAQAGMEILRRGGFETRPYKDVINAHLEPTPRIRESRSLVKSVKIHSMIDLSDGLSIDLQHITRESGVGAKIYKENIPIAEETKEIARAVGEDPLDYALSGGEDFELLFTLSKQDFEIGKKALEDETGTRMTAIGEILPKEEGIYLLDKEKKIPMKQLEIKGFQHF
jgi:thiamine-monophosphate kinase